MRRLQKRKPRMHGRARLTREPRQKHWQQEKTKKPPANLQSKPFKCIHTHVLLFWHVRVSAKLHPVPQLRLTGTQSDGSIVSETALRSRVAAAMPEVVSGTLYTCQNGTELVSTL